MQKCEIGKYTNSHEQKSKIRSTVSFGAEHAINRDNYYVANQQQRRKLDAKEIFLPLSNFLESNEKTWCFDARSLKPFLMLTKITLVGQYFSKDSSPFNFFRRASIVTVNSTFEFRALVSLVSIILTLELVFKKNENSSQIIGQIENETSSPCEDREPSYSKVSVTREKR